MTLEDVAARLAELLQPGGRFHNALEDTDTPTELVPGHVWQVYVWPKASAGAAVLRVYRIGDAESVVAALWRNEVRSLLRLSRRNFPALPRIRDAWADSRTGFAYLLMDDAGDPLHRQAAAVDRLSDRSQAFQAFATLAEALALLHGDGVIHRALTPRAICGHVNPSLAVTLDQFQFSAMIAAWLRTGAQVNPEASRWLASVPADELVFLPPERLGPLFGEPVRHLESFSADVFGLGMVGASWFAGPPDAAACARVVREGRYSRSEHEALIASRRQRLMASDLPRSLALLISEMLEPIAAHRPTSALAVSDILRGSYGSILSQLEEREEELQPLNLWFMKWTAERLYFQYRATQTHPDRLDEQEYAQLIAEDLEGGEVCWSPDGFLPWSEERDEEARRRCADARVLLIGRRFAYFCQYYQDYDTAAADDRVLLIKYPCERWLVREHIASIPRRAAPPVRAKFFAPPARVRIPSARSWKPLVEPVRFEKKADESADPVVAANWLVRIQQGRLDAQSYDFVRVSSAAPAIVLRGEWRRPYEPASDRAAFEELARRSGLVDDMGDFFEDVARRAEAADEDSPVFVIGDATGQDLGIRLEFEKREDGRTVRFRPRFAGGDRSFPEAGRVWVEQGAQGHVLGRQRRAARSLSLNLDLVNQLRSPRSVDLAVSHVEDVQTDAETRALLQRIDGAWPLFCVQGPPGTGKTFLSSLVVYSALRREPFGRILVSAQAHHALDNLLDGIVKRFGDRAPLMVRLAGDATRAKVSSAGAERFPETQVQRLRDRAASVDLPTDAALRPIVAHWKATARDRKLDLDLASRVTRSAAVVFTTAAGAGSRALPADISFDLVVLEEAARGWLSEMLVPLVRGERWVLVGDQRQLPAYEAQQLRRALETDIRDQITATAGGPPVGERLVPYLKYFGHVMETQPTLPAPREMLSRQHRMHPDISAVISAVFYDGQLTNAEGVRRAHGVRADWLPATRGFVWIDTSVYGRPAWEADGALRNDLEVKLITYLVNRLGPFPTHDPTIRPAVILSPYLRQLEELRNKVRGVERRDIVTVDSFQGGEAEVAIVSFVRFNSFEPVRSGIGFLGEPERVNVMLSRARRLLLVVGALQHFERFKGTYWEQLSRLVRDTPGAVVDAAATGFMPLGG